MARSGSPYSTPRDANRVPLLVAASSADGVTPVVLEADPTTHLLQVGGTITATVDESTLATSANQTNGTQVTQVAAGTAIIGKVTTDQTTHGTTDLVSADITKVNGTAVSATNPLPSSVSDGTNTANILKSDGTAAGQNSIFIAGSYQEASLSLGPTPTSGQFLLPSTDVKGYAYFSMQVAGGTWTGTYIFEGSNDNTNWTQTYAALFNNNSGGITNFTANGFWRGAIHSRYIRVRCSVTGTGTTLATLALFTGSPSDISNNVAASQSATWTVGSNSATGSAFPANAFSNGVKALTTSPTAATTGNLVALTGDTMGEALVSTGGLVTTSVPANASNVVVKAAPGRLCRLLVTATGVTAMVIYDNATTNSGTIIGALPASAAIGGVYDFEMPAAAGITIAGSATNPAVTISWI